jgi:Tol biopolymer transport system component
MSHGSASAPETGPQNRLDSWKEIAAYLGRSVRCVQQWEAEYGLPVHRLNYDKKASVYAYKEALDAWRIAREKHLEPPASPVPERAAHGRYHALTRLVIAAIILSIAGGIVYIKSVSGRPGARQISIRPLAIASGTEMMPAFSPDGTRIAYVWDGGQPEDTPIFERSIYVKQVDADKTVRITDGQQDFFPQWSPDGRLISFCRPPQILVVPAIGGRELALGQITWGGIGPLQAWTGDSGGVISSDKDPVGRQSPLWFFPLDMSGRTQITDPPAGSVDLTPAVSPDGRTLAFTRNSASLANNIFLLPLEGHRPAGPLRQLTFNQSTTYFYLTWAPDSRSLYCLRSRPDPAVIRIAVTGAESVETIPQILPSVTNFLAASPHGNKLAWSTAVYDVDLWRARLPSEGTRSSPHTRIARTTLGEQEAALSPDGSMLVFLSGRDGGNSLWLSAGDGTNPSVFESRKAHHPSWSPDGKLIAYELFDRGGVDIYVKPVRQGAGWRATDDPSEAQRPVFSRDGRWIYFSSNRGGIRNMWKVPVKGGPMVQLTRNGGFRGEESTDGTTLYFTAAPAGEGVWAIPLKGGDGDGRKLFGPLVSADAFQVFDDGIYAVMRTPPNGGASLVFYSFSSRQFRPVENLDSSFEGRISISTDRRWLVYDALRLRSGDLMMMEGL